MAYTLQIKKSEQITIPVADADKLLSCGNGDAALLYLYLLRCEGRADAEEVLRTLHFSPARRSEAEEALCRLGLLGERTAAAEPAPETKPNYSSLDVAEALERNGEYAELEKNVARLLQKPALTTAESQMLLGLYDYLSLPVDVIYLLVHHCVEVTEKRRGVGLRPTMRQIEKEGYIWHRRHLDNTRAANSYLKQYHKRQGLYPAYMAVLQLGDRAPAPAEEKYLEEWVSMGFSPETVALAYDKTMLKCHELRWAYLTGILRRWHRDGLHTAADIRQKDRPKEAPTGERAKEDRMQDFIREVYGK